MTITPDQIIPSGFTDNLNTDFIAVNAQGTVIGRATTKEALERSCPDATYFTGADLEGAAKAPTIAEAALGSTEAALAAVVAQGVPISAEAVKTTTIAAEPTAEVIQVAEGIAAQPAAPVEAEPIAEEPKPVAQDPLDHDNKDGRGGSLRGEQSTSHKGAVNRQRKPSGK